jgi:hypothetical protein
LNETIIDRLAVNALPGRSVDRILQVETLLFVQDLTGFTG